MGYLKYAIPKYLEVATFKQSSTVSHLIMCLISLIVYAALLKMYHVFLRLEVAIELLEKLLLGVLLLKGIKRLQLLSWSQLVSIILKKVALIFWLLNVKNS